MGNTNLQVGDYIDPYSLEVGGGSSDLMPSDEYTIFSLRGRTAVPLTNGETAIVNEDGIVEEIR